MKDGSAPLVAVVGAGPAGCAAAIHLAQAGVRVLVLEKGLPGKDKACGDAWIPSAVEELRALETPARGMFASAPMFSQMHGDYLGREVWSLDLTPHRGAMARRAVADQWLRDGVVAAGGSIWHAAEAVDLRIDGGRLALAVRRGAETQPLTPSAVVLASGAGCRIARRAGLDGDPGFGAAVSAYVATQEDAAVPKFLFGDPDPGYGWCFPMGAKAANVGVFALTKAAASTLRAQLAALRLSFGEPGAAGARGGILPLWSGRGVDWRLPAGVVSCGDAAGLVDPLSGEGLTAALVSGKRAGAAVASFLSGVGGALDAYSRWVRKWAKVRYGPSLPNRIFSAWVGLAPAERQLYALLADYKRRPRRRLSEGRISLL